jgi:ribosomal protein S18 acetylase RimI-like enzyme
MAVVRPESFARWSPQAARQQAEFIVRLGADRDVEACVRLVVAIGAGDGDAWRRTLTRTVRDGRRRALFVAEAHGEVVGYGRVVFAEADPEAPAAAPAGWYLLGLVVDQAWRRRGIGEALTRARMAWVAERAERLYYFTQPENRASQALHERLGFVKVPGTWIPPGGRPEDAGSQQFYRVDLRVRDRPSGG